jgi:FlaA1/EpsC-like NDP-sugar epimerase
VIPFFKKLIDDGAEELPVTDLRMTRFWITLDEGVELVLKALKEARGGETYISKIPSFKITDLVAAMAPDLKIKEIGIREGEKLHEAMITEDDSNYTFEYENHYVVYPHMNWWDMNDIDNIGVSVARGFRYSSEKNTQWLSVEEIKERLKTLEMCI